MSKALQNDIVNYVAPRKGITSAVIQQQFKKVASPQKISESLGELVKQKRLNRLPLPNGQKIGFLYQAPVHPSVEEQIGKIKQQKADYAKKLIVKFDDLKRTWQVEGGKPFSGNGHGQAEASGAFNAWWAAHGPFRDEYWRGAPRTPEIEKYQESFKGPAYTAWIAGIKYAKTGNWLATWEEVAAACQPKQ